MILCYIDMPVSHKDTNDFFANRKIVLNDSMNTRPSCLRPAFTMLQFIEVFVSFSNPLLSWFQRPELIDCNSLLHSFVSNLNWCITCHRIAIDHFRHAPRSTSWILCPRSIKLLNRRFREQDLFAAIRSNGCSQCLKTNLESAGTQLTIQGIAREFVGQLLCI